MNKTQQLFHQVIDETPEHIKRHLYTFRPKHWTQSGNQRILDEVMEYARVFLIRLIRIIRGRKKQSWLQIGLQCPFLPDVEKEPRNRRFNVVNRANQANGALLTQVLA